MAKPRHTRHGGEGGNKPHRSRSKLRASRFGEGASKRKRSKKPKRRYETGAGGPEKKRKKRRKSSKKRRKLRFTIRYDKPGRSKRARRRRSGTPRIRAKAPQRAARSIGIAAAPSVLTPEIATLTAAITSRAHRPIVPRAPFVPRVLVPKVPAAAPVSRTILPKPPVDLAARTVRRAVSKVAG